MELSVLADMLCMLIMIAWTQLSTTGIIRICVVTQPFMTMVILVAVFLLTALRLNESLVVSELAQSGKMGIYCTKICRSGLFYILYSGR